MEHNMHYKVVVAGMGYMAFLSFGVLFGMFRRRVAALKSKQIRVGDFKTYANEGAMPPSVLQASRHYQNIFEMPTLFYAAALVAITQNIADIFTTCLVAGFCVFRTAHAYIHFGDNNVFHRMKAFAGSVFVLMALWLYVLGNFFL